jgi:flagellar basal body-associated protein FliL
MKKPNNRGGVLWTILIIVAILIVLGYFGFNMRNIVNSPVVQDNLGFAKEVALNIWNNYLKVSAIYVWNLILKVLPSHT